jgi:hypothetical protein
MSDKPIEASSVPSPPGDPDAGWAYQQIQEALRGLQFGHVTVTVQDGVVVQLERVERKRWRRASK